MTRVNSAPAMQGSLRRLVVSDWQIILGSGIGLLLLWAKGISKIAAAWLKLPEDPCHYHTRAAPPLIARYFLDPASGHVEPEGNLFTLGSALLAGVTLGILIVIARRIFRHCGTLVAPDGRY